RYFENSHEVVVQQPRMTFFLDDGKRQAHVQGTEGHLMLDGQEVQTLTLKGNVVVTLDDLRLDTDEATYVKARDLITSPAEVVMHGPTLDVQGRGMEVEVGPQHVRLLDDVHTVIRNNAARS